MRIGAATAGLERQTGLRAIQGLDLALLIAAQHDGVLRRCQADPDHVGELLQKLRITGKFETFGQMRLPSVILPGPLKRVFADPLSAGHRACAPMRRAGRLGLERGVDPLSDASDRVAGFATTPRGELPHATDALLAHPSAPQRSGLATNPARHRGGLVGLPLRGAQNDPRTQHNLLRRRTRTDPLLKADCLRVR